jgi:hypothetical protein
MAGEIRSDNCRHYLAIALRGRHSPRQWCSLPVVGLWILPMARPMRAMTGGASCNRSFEIFLMLQLLSSYVIIVVW